MEDPEGGMVSKHFPFLLSPGKAQVAVGCLRNTGMYPSRSKWTQGDKLFVEGL